MSLVDEFVRNAESAGFVVHRGGPAPSIEGAGVSRALYGLADTGSVVLAASPDEPRARSLLPSVHVSLLDENRILPGLADLFEAVGEDLPSALAIVTGPSRSADIEQQLVVGVHGPGEVHVVLSASSAPAMSGGQSPRRGS
jgi:L-lactate dehydrogenase complex protein LldG